MRGQPSIQFRLHLRRHGDALRVLGDMVPQILHVRDLLGPTDSKKAAKGTIRGDLGVDVMVNVCHASDTPEAAAQELKRFFQEGELFSY